MDAAIELAIWPTRKDSFTTDWLVGCFLVEHIKTNGYVVVKMSDGLMN